MINIILACLGGALIGDVVAILLASWFIKFLDRHNL